MVIRGTTWRLLLGDHLQHTSLDFQRGWTVRECCATYMRGWHDRPMISRNDLSCSLMPMSESKYVLFRLGLLRPSDTPERQTNEGLRLPKYAQVSLIITFKPIDTNISISIALLPRPATLLRPCLRILSPSICFILQILDPVLETTPFCLQPVDLDSMFLRCLWRLISPIVQRMIFLLSLPQYVQPLL